MKWGAKARVLAPVSLREEIRLEVEAMLDSYTAFQVSGRADT